MSASSSGPNALATSGAGTFHHVHDAYGRRVKFCVGEGNCSSIGNEGRQQMCIYFL